VGVIGEDRHLPPRVGTGGNPHFAQDDGHEPGRDLLARGDHGIIFARVVQRRGLVDPADELVGFTRHGGNDNGHLMAGLDLAFDVAGRLPNALDIGDGGAAELDHDARQGNPRRFRRLHPAEGV
jgi:hypothetical protein